MPNQKPYSSDNTLQYVILKFKTLLSNKVDKEFKTGSSTQYKELSDNNYSNVDKTKVDNMLTTEQVQTMINTSTSSAVKYCGQVNTVDDLPVDASVGDMYDVVADHHNYIWDGTAWDDTGGSTDMTDYVKNEDLVEITNAEVDDMFNV